jgi:thiol-disulfide isomerase/thioredoxin
MPPLDVKNPQDIASFLQRLTKGPLTIVLVYADWCGHCHTFMPHFDKASKSPERSVQSVKVNETMLEQVNSKLDKPIQVNGYPSLLLMDHKGNNVTNLETVRSTDTMKNVVNNAGKLYMNKSPLTATSLNKNMSVKHSMNTTDPIQTTESIKTPDTNLVSSDMESSDLESSELESSDMESSDLEPPKSELPYESGVPLSSSPIITEGRPEDPSFSSPFVSAKKNPNYGENALLGRSITNSPFNIIPTTSEEDMKSITTKGGSYKKRGSLYQKIKKTVYMLAPPDVLFSTMKKRKMSKRSKSHRRHK